jgi:hypothetical protein
MVKVASTYTRAAPSSAGRLSGSVILLNPNPATRYVSDVRVMVQYSDQRWSAEVRATCPRGQFGMIELPANNRPLKCGFSILAPMRPKVQVSALMARAIMPEGRDFTLLTDVNKLGSTGGYRLQQAPGNTGECAVVSEALREVTVKKVWGEAPFDRQVRICGTKTFKYELQLLGQLLGACEVKVGDSSAHAWLQDAHISQAPAAMGRPSGRP